MSVDFKSSYLHINPSNFVCSTMNHSQAVKILLNDSGSWCCLIVITRPLLAFLMMNLDYELLVTNDKTTKSWLQNLNNFKFLYIVTSELDLYQDISSPWLDHWSSLLHQLLLQSKHRLHLQHQESSRHQKPSPGKYLKFKIKDNWWLAFFEKLKISNALDLVKWKSLGSRIGLLKPWEDLTSSLFPTCFQNSSSSSSPDLVLTMSSVSNRIEAILH